MTWRITSKFGDMESFRNSPHKGIDLAMKEGEELYSIREGVIKFADYGDKNAGRTVFIETESGQTFIYGHLSKFTNHLKEGDFVEKGELIGYAGNTGHSYGSHLHFGVREGGKFIDPSPYIEDIQNMGSLIADGSSSIDKGYSLLELFSGSQDSVASFLKHFTTNFISLSADLINHFCINYSVLAQYLECFFNFFS
ncbi:M23 family metallopeptidase [Alkalihalophilus pseudofirmus]|uniref:M23 family metallopeptidase n=1 Tax=Alkalihalophilus pseudofirmus TaxID=79885 RepID=UPI00259B0753|nr:M23 family metallopeptidase [Alkalihalophilus pseudofirmus]WEG18526.1 M23 family metallopeptidase [Alkalihalophilus pseudofirmus]